MKIPVDLRKIIEISDEIYTFAEIMDQIDLIKNVDLNHIYIDGTKIEANANKYTWVWKKTCITNRNKAFEKITYLIKEINKNDLSHSSISIGTRDEYCIEYMEYILNEYKKITGIEEESLISFYRHIRGQQIL